MCVGQARAENARLRAELLAGSQGGSGAAATGTVRGGSRAEHGDVSTLRKQLKDFTINTQLELEKKLQVRSASSDKSAGWPAYSYSCTERELVYEPCCACGYTVYA